MAIRTFMTKVWGFDVPVGPLQFSTQGWRHNASVELNPGDIVVLVGTGREPTSQDERGRLLGIMEPSTEPVMSLDFDLPQRSVDFDEEGGYRWPYGLLNRRAWRLVDRPLLNPDISTRRFSMDAALGIVQLTDEEARRISVLRREEVQLLRPRISASARIEGIESARRRVSPVPTTTRHGVMHMRTAPAYTYAMEIKGAVEGAFKIGWAFDYKHRARAFNQASLPALGGLRYLPRLYQLWDTARQAYQMEQSILDRFSRHRHHENHEVLLGLASGALEAYWTDLIRSK